MDNKINILYRGLKAKVTTQLEKGKTLFRIEWPDNTLDWIYQDEKHGWKSLTLMAPTQKTELGQLIEKQLY